MASSISYGNCPCCGEIGSLHMELNCNTMEDDHFCMSCGYSYHYYFVRDDNGQLVRKPVEFNIEDCVFGVRDYNSKEIIYKRPVSDVEGLSEDIIAEWINYLPFKRKPDDTAPEGSRNLYYIGGEEPQQLFYIGDRITVSDDKTKLIVLQAETKEETTDGHGVIYIGSVNGGGSMYDIPEDMTREEVVEQVKQIINDNPGKIKYIKATWFNKETKKVEVLFEDPEPVEDDEESMMDIVDDISEMLEEDSTTTDYEYHDGDDDLPF